VDAPATPETDRYINRELSLLEFNWRVLAQAADHEIPLLERLRFLCISCTNLDEFFEVRVAALKQRLESGAPAPGPDNLTPQQLLEQIREHTLELVRNQYELLNDTLFPELNDERIRFLVP
jgi:polyphosphate kinase